MNAPLYESQISSLPRIHQGKVRDIYAVGEDYMLIVTSDRLSAFDVILPRPIPGKGQVLTEVTDFWMRRFAHIVPNHFGDEVNLADHLSAEELALCQGRAIVVRKLLSLIHI